MAQTRRARIQSRQAGKGGMTPQQTYNLSKMANGVSATLFIVILALTIIGGVLLDTLVGAADWLVALVIAFGSLIALYFLFALKVANQWEKAIVLRFGKFQGLKGPGTFWIIPIVDTIPAWIDHRVMVTPFDAEKTLTKDTVPVDVDAVLFWLVWDAEKAALEVEDYGAAITWAAQTALREIIGQMDLAAILVGRAVMDAELQKIIDERTTPWGGHRAVGRDSLEAHDTTSPTSKENTTSGGHSLCMTTRSTSVVTMPRLTSKCFFFVSSSCAPRFSFARPTAIPLRCFSANPAKSSACWR